MSEKYHLFIPFDERERSCTFHKKNQVVIPLNLAFCIFALHDYKQSFEILNYREMALANNIERVNECDLQAVLSMESI